MELLELKNKFLEENPDYSNDVSNFFDYITQIKKLDLSANTYIVNAVDTDEIIKSLEYNIGIGRIKKQEPARKYISAVGQLFEFLLRDSQYKNTDFMQELANPPTREKSYKRIAKEFIDSYEKLLPKETYNCLSRNEINNVIDWCDTNISTAMQSMDIATSKIGFKRLVAALCLKTIILTGITYRVARNVTFCDLNTAKNTLRINGYDIRLPLTLSVQYQFYYKMRINLALINPKSYLFIKYNGAQWGDATGDSGIPNFLKTIIQKTDITGVVKYGISQLIKCRLNDSIIMELTGASKELFAGCLLDLKNDNTGNQIINSTLLLTEQYYNL